MSPSTMYIQVGSMEKCSHLQSALKLHGKRKWQPTPVLLLGKYHGGRSLVGCSPWGPEESNTTEQLYFHFSLSCIGEGNGNPVQCSCLKNPRGRRAWWAVIYVVAQGRTRLKRLSNRSSKLQDTMYSNVLTQIVH